MKIVGMTEEQTRKYLEATMRVENTTGNPGIINSSGHVGNYQMSADALKDAGYIRQDAAVDKNNITDDSVWVPPASWTKFSQSSSMQDDAMIKYTNRNAATLMNKDYTSKSGVKSSQRINSESDVNDVSAYLGAAHLMGAEAVRQRGLDAGADANGSTAINRATYLRMVASNIDIETAHSAVYGKSPNLITGYDSGLNGTGKTSITNLFTGTVYEPHGFTPRFNNLDIVLTNTNNGGQESQLPTKNVLDLYSNTTPIFTLSILTKDEINNPEVTYKTGSLRNIIIHSGGRSSDNGVETQNGRIEYMIDDVTIDALVSYNKKSTSTNAFSIEFNVLEMYSMGFFLQSLQIAAHNAGYETYIRDAAFLLTIDFMGYDSNDVPTKIENCTRHIPIRIYSAEMTTTAGGSNYQVKAVVWNELALQNSVALFDNDIAISGGTVAEILQTGENSLQYILNSYMADQARNDPSKPSPDEIAIIFPDFTAPSPTENSRSNMATVDPASLAKQSPQVKLSLTRGSTQTLIQDSATLNSIGKASMGFTHNHGGSMVPGKENQVVDPETGVINRAKIKLDASKRQLTFARSTSIIEAITQVIIESDIGRKCLDNVDSNGMRDWFRIETQVFIGSPNDGNVNTLGGLPKLYVYKIVPYKVSASRFAANNQTSSDMRFLRSNAAKEYNYIYTGKNTDILDFQIKFNNAFYTSILPSHQDGTPALNQTQNGMGGTLVSAPFNTATGTQPTSLMESADIKIKESDGFSGSNDDYKVAVARKFYEALVNSPVDLITASLVILGDPYYLVDSGIGNWSDSNTGSFNTTASQAMDYQSGEVDILINFRTPIDISSEKGYYSFDKTTGIVEGFSGLYQVITVSNRFDKGKFTQELNLVRRPKQTEGGNLPSYETSPTNNVSSSIDPNNITIPFNIPIGIINPSASV